MSKKDFELIARVVRDARLLHSEDRNRQFLAEDFAEAIAKENPRFDKARFVEAATEKEVVA